jgi:hypothetical protein
MLQILDKEIVSRLERFCIFDIVCVRCAAVYDDCPKLAVLEEAGGAQEGIAQVSGRVLYTLEADVERGRESEGGACADPECINLKGWTWLIRSKANLAKARLELG